MNPKEILSTHAESAASGDWEWAYRCLTTGLARALHQCAVDEGPEALERATAAAPKDIGLKWNALLAAVTAFECSEHGVRIPEWTRSAENRLDKPWSAHGPVGGGGKLAWLPAAFLQHGALGDPRECDLRCARRDDWEPTR